MDERWVTDTTTDGKYHFYALKAGNRQEIARSCYYSDKDEMLADLAWVRGERSVIGKGAKLVGGSLVSAFMLASNEASVPDPKVESAPVPEESITKSEPIEEVEPVVEAEKIVEAEPIKVTEPIVEKAVPAAAAVSEKGGCSKWLWWLLPIILLLLLCYYFCRGCDDKVMETSTAVSGVVETVTDVPKAALEKVEESAKTVGDVVDKTTDAVGKTVSGAIDKTTNTVGGVVDDASKLANKTAEKLEAAISSGDSFVLEGLNFVYNKDILTEDSQKILANVVDILKKHPDINIRIEGHTDDVGHDAYNKALSQKRANSILKHLVSNGIASSRLRAVGYGEGHPIASNSTDEGRAKNRRIEFKILKK